MSLYTPNTDETSGDKHADLIRARITDLSDAVIVCYANLQSYLNHPDATESKVRRALGKDVDTLDYLMRMFRRMAKRVDPDFYFRMKYLTPKKKKKNAAL